MAAYLVDVQAHVPARWLTGADATRLTTEDGQALVTPAEVATFRFSSCRGFLTSPDDDPPNTYYEPRLAVPAAFEHAVFRDGVTGGASDIQWGEIEIVNIDGALDDFADYAVDGRPFQVRLAEEGAPLAAARIVAAGIVAWAELTWSRLILHIRDRAAAFEKPLQEHRYAGTNDGPHGFEGGADLSGTYKPLAYGLCRNVPAERVNASTLTYQVHDGPVQAIDAVYDKGLALAAGPDFASSEALASGTFAAGHYATCLAAGLFRLWTTPAGEVTADVRGDVSDGHVSSAAGVIGRILRTRTDLAEAEIGPGDLDALESANSSPLGLFVADAMSVAEALDTICRSVGAWWSFDRLGRFRCARFEAPDGDPVATFTAVELLDANDGLSLLPAHDDAGGTPYWRVVVTYDVNWTTQGTSSLAGAVDEERRTWLARGSRKVVAEDPATRERHLLAPELEIETLLASAVDAEAEAARLLAMHGAPRRRFVARVKAEYGLDVGLGDVVALRHARFGLALGRLFRVIGCRTDLEEGLMEFDLYG